MKKCFCAISVCFLLFFNCEGTKEKADLIVYNANIYTVDADFSTVEAFAISKGKFLAVGSSFEIQNKYDADNIIDAEGKTITPGLIDAHCHFYGLGLNQLLVNLVGTKSFDEVLERVQDFQQKNIKKVIRGRGWDQNDWDIKEFPTKKELDAMYPNIPVALQRVDGHAYLVNQAALDLAGITVKTKIEGGEIVKVNIAGAETLTGVLVDKPMELIDAVFPLPNRQEQIKALKDAEKICLDYGLTTVSDAGIDRTTIELIDSLQQAGEMNMRVYAMISNKPENLDYYLEKEPYKTERLNVTSVKVYGDGALGSRGAALKKEYTDKHDHFGAMITPVAEIEKLAERIVKTKFQMNTHAIGDSANVVVLKAYKKALKGKDNRRWRIEHAQVIAQEDFNYFKEGIIPSVQPTHATSDMYWAEDRLGNERIKGAYAYKKMLNIAGLVALGTDFPVEQVSPFLTFYAAVSRKDVKGYPAEGFQIGEALSREETLKGMTLWAAYANFEENEKGSIEVGKYADFTMYDQDLMRIPVAEIPFVKAEKTFINGKHVN